MPKNKTDVPIHSLSSLKQTYNYMHFRDFYTSIYNIRLGFIKIERKTCRAEARAKPAKKTGSLRRSGSPRLGIPFPRRSRQGSEYGLRFA